MTKGDDEGRKSGHERLFFSRTKWLQAAVKGTEGSGDRGKW